MASVSDRIERKRQEADFLDTTETDRVERQEKAAAARLGGRQPASGPKNPSGVRGGLRDRRPK
jgi:hypothetical protein